MITINIFGYKRLGLLFFLPLLVCGSVFADTVIPYNPGNGILPGSDIGGGDGVPASQTSLPGNIGYTPASDLRLGVGIDSVTNSPYGAGAANYDIVTSFTANGYDSYNTTIDGFGLDYIGYTSVGYDANYEVDRTENKQTVVNPTYLVQLNDTGTYSSGPYANPATAPYAAVSPGLYPASVITTGALAGYTVETYSSFIPFSDISINRNLLSISGQTAANYGFISRTDIPNRVNLGGLVSFTNSGTYTINIEPITSISTSPDGTYTFTDSSSTNNGVQVKYGALGYYKSVSYTNPTNATYMTGGSITNSSEYTVTGNSSGAYNNTPTNPNSTGIEAPATYVSNITKDSDSLNKSETTVSGATTTTVSTNSFTDAGGGSSTYSNYLGTDVIPYIPAASTFSTSTVVSDTSTGFGGTFNALVQPLVFNPSGPGTVTVGTPTLKAQANNHTLTAEDLTFGRVLSGTSVSGTTSITSDSIPGDIVSVTSPATSLGNEYTSTTPVTASTNSNNNETVTLNATGAVLGTNTTGLRLTTTTSDNTHLSGTLNVTADIVKERVINDATINLGKVYTNSYTNGTGFIMSSMGTHDTTADATLNPYGFNMTDGVATVNTTNGALLNDNTRFGANISGNFYNIASGNYAGSVGLNAIDEFGNIINPNVNYTAQVYDPISISTTAGTNGTSQDINNDAAVVGGYRSAGFLQYAVVGGISDAYGNGVGSGLSGSGWNLTYGTNSNDVNYNGSLAGQALRYNDQLSAGSGVVVDIAPTVGLLHGISTVGVEADYGNDSSIAGSGSQSDQSATWIAQYNNTSVSNTIGSSQLYGYVLGGTPTDTVNGNTVANDFSTNVYIAGNNTGVANASVNVTSVNSQYDTAFSVNSIVHSDSSNKVNYLIFGVNGLDGANNAFILNTNVAAANTTSTPYVLHNVSYTDGTGATKYAYINSVYSNYYATDNTSSNILGYGTVAEWFYNIVNTQLAGTSDSFFHFGSGSTISGSFGLSNPFLGLDTNGVAYGATSDGNGALYDSSGNVIYDSTNGINNLQYGFSVDLAQFLSNFGASPATLSDFRSSTAANGWMSILADIEGLGGVTFDADQLAQLDPTLDPNAWMGFYSYGNGGNSSFAWSVLNHNSEFALDVTPTPEVNPSLVLLLLLGMLGLTKLPYRRLA